MIHFGAPGDKSISHRFLMLASLAPRVSTARGLLDAEDIRATADCLGALGVTVESGPADATAVRGPIEWLPPVEALECGNSGTAARLLMGLLAGLGLPAVIRGDASLSRRPMDRVVYPLQAMGARIRYLEREGTLPVELEERRSGALRPLMHRPRIASAQVKSCLLLAVLTGGVRLEVLEPVASRDHTERLLHAMGARLSRGLEGGEGSRVTLEPDPAAAALAPLDLRVPGDFSSAAFLMAAAWLGGEPVEIRGVGLNPTRTGLLEVAREIGAPFEAVESEVTAGEPIGKIRASPSGRLKAFEIGGVMLPRLVDEVPVLAVLAARADGISRISGAEELRHKESDRLSVLAANLRGLGVACREHRDGLEIEGTRAPLAGAVKVAGDHRIAMAFGALGATPACELTLDDASSVSASYPEFWRDLSRLAASEAS